MTHKTGLTVANERAAIEKNEPLVDATHPPALAAGQDDAGDVSPCYCR